MNFKEFQKSQLNEVLITFGNQAYPKFGQVVILAGGAGSGKGFIKNKLLGIEGITLDVDRLKELAMASNIVATRIKRETGYNINKFDMKNPENVSKIHSLLSAAGTIKGQQKKVFTGIMTADKDRKPNLIFDVTLKDMNKVVQIATQADMLGYDVKNIHLVWVMNDINVAMKQNKERSRVVPENILVQTHDGASWTMKKLMAMGEGMRNYLDGDMWISFNKAGVDTDVVKSANKGMYISKANVLKIKQKGKAPKRVTELEDDVIAKIAAYAPNSDTWAMALGKKDISNEK
ncbi:MAG: hypothetical protein [Caudoviricetes sp.]|nr:MAG: hypothetical protein [Caudoviricetes sp.]